LWLLNDFFMPSIKLLIEYDGTAYCGWQFQPNGLTIQEVLEEGLLKLLGEQVRLRSSGRTDAGVHAKGMVAVFTTTRSLPPAAYSHGLNNLIPPDIAIQSAQEVPDSFNPRADALGKLYRYTILNAPSRSPLNRFTSWLIKEQLDLDAMSEAARAFIGEHDFRAFQAANCAAKTTVRTITGLEITASSDGFITMDVRGTGFLRNMVRIMVGTLVAVGRGRMKPEVVAELLAQGNRSCSGATAPPQGLCLMEVYY
jgi:tRNA pseudouridine38-40 synthase